MMYIAYMISWWIKSDAIKSQAITLLGMFVLLLLLSIGVVYGVHGVWMMFFLAGYFRSGFLHGVRHCRGAKMHA